MRLKCHTNSSCFPLLLWRLFLCEQIFMHIKPQFILIRIHFECSVGFKHEFSVFIKLKLQSSRRMDFFSFFQSAPLFTYICTCTYNFIIVFVSFQGYLLFCCFRLSDLSTAFWKHSIIFQCLTTLKYYPQFLMDSGNASWEFPLDLNNKIKNQPYYPCMLLHFTCISTKPDRTEKCIWSVTVVWLSFSVISTGLQHKLWWNMSANMWMVFI